MGSGRRLLRNESGSLRDVMNCDRSSLKYTAFRSGIGEDDQPRFAWIAPIFSAVIPLTLTGRTCCEWPEKCLHPTSG